MAALTKLTDRSDGKTKTNQLEEEWTMDKIAELMVVDGNNNQQNGSNILWWIDICVEEVIPNVVSNIIQTFGLPPDIDTCFYNDILTPERESRIRKGHGKIKRSASKNDGHLLNVESLSMFVQS